MNEFSIFAGYAATRIHAPARPVTRPTTRAAALYDGPPAMKRPGIRHGVCPECGDSWPLTPTGAMGSHGVLRRRGDVVYLDRTTVCAGFLAQPETRVS